jgi:hypothetical protein
MKGTATTITSANSAKDLINTLIHLVDSSQRKIHDMKDIP